MLSSEHGCMVVLRMLRQTAPELTNEFEHRRGVWYLARDMILIEHLFISPGHNYFGHHGQSAGEHPLLEVDQVECVAGQGLRGDRFFGFKENYQGQITLFSLEVFDALRAALQLPQAQPGATRRNVFTRGVDLNSLIGREFEIQGIRFAGACECSPCSWMNSALGPGAEAWLHGRGGLRARILSDGLLRRDRPAAS